MTLVLAIAHLLASVIVLAESLFKAELSRPGKPSTSIKDRILEIFKSLSWLMIAFGSGTSLLLFILDKQIQNLYTPRLDHTVMMVGFAFLIVRTRFKEIVH